MVAPDARAKTQYGAKIRARVVTSKIPDSESNEIFEPRTLDAVLARPGRKTVDGKTRAPGPGRTAEGRRGHVCGRESRGEARNFKRGTARRRSVEADVTSAAAAATTAKPYPGCLPRRRASDCRRFHSSKIGSVDPIDTERRGFARLLANFAREIHTDGRDVYVRFSERY